MPKSLPGTHSCIRDAVAYILRSPNRAGVLYNIDSIAHLLNIAVGVKSDAAVRFDNKIVAEAFANGAFDEYPLVYDHIGYEGDEYILYVCRKREKSGRRLRRTSICRFSSMEAGRAANIVESIPDLNIIPPSKKDLLLDFIKDKPANSVNSEADLVPRSELNNALAQVAQLKLDMEKANAELLELRASNLEVVEVDVSNNSTTKSRKRPISPTADDQPRSRKQKCCTMFRYIIDGEAGEMAIDRHQNNIPMEELLANIKRDHLKPDDVSKDNVEKRKSTKYKVVRFNGVDVFCPIGVSLAMTSTLSMLKNKETKINRLVTLFSREQSIFSERSKRCIAAFCMQCPGGSDQSKSMLLACAWKVVFIELNISITNEQLAKGTPCQTTLSNWDYRLAADCYILTTSEMSLSSYYAMGQDGGHRQNLDHLIKTVTYPFKSNDGRLYLKNVCIDIDTAGKTAEEVADGCRNTIAKLSKYTDSKCIGITGDSGGGGAVQSIHPILVRKGVMDSWSRFIRCLLHALNKCLERAIIAAMGSQGLGMNTCIQLLWSAMNMFRAIIKEGGLELYDKYHQIVIDKLMSDEEWQAEAERVQKQAFDEWWEIMNSDKVDEVTDGMIVGMRNLQLPVFTRWQSLLPMLGLFLKNEVMIYFMAVAITQDRDAGKYLHTCACEVISLMNLRAEPDESLN